jgi:hypothetical protein
MAEAFQRTDEAREAFEEQDPNNVKFTSVFRCLSGFYTVQQRDLCEKEKTAVQSFI